MVMEEVSNVGPRAAMAQQLEAEGGKTQYFVVATPRVSVDGPGASDENADHNVGQHRVLAPANGKTQAAAKTPGSRSARGTACVTPRYTLQPCLRPQTPTRSRDSRTESPAGRSRSQPPLTPDQCGASDADSLHERCTEMSVYSETSHASQESRLSRLSKRSTSQKFISSKEMDRLKVEEKRKEVRDMIKRNQVNCRKALLATDVGSAGRAVNTTKVTIPEDFAFSTEKRARTPRGARTPRTPRVDDSLNDSVGSLRAKTPRSAAPAKSWQPELTVPKGPVLRTMRRLSGARRTASCPPEEADAAAGGSGDGARTRACTPEKRREVYRAAAQIERSKVAVVKASGSFAPPARGVPKATAAAAAARAARESAAAPIVITAAGATASTAQERAQRARMLAQQKYEEAQATKDKTSVFKRSQAAAASAARPAQPSGKQAAPLARAVSDKAFQPASTLSHAASERQLRTPRVSHRDVLSASTPKVSHRDALSASTPKLSHRDILSASTPTVSHRDVLSASVEGLSSPRVAASIDSHGSVSKRVGALKAPTSRRASFGSAVERPCCSPR